MPRSCAICGRDVAPDEHLSRHRRRCDDCMRSGNVPVRADALVVIDHGKPYRADVGAQLFVAHFGAGATLECVALAIGVTRERVRQIERAALVKLLARLRRRGITARVQLSAHADDDEPGDADDGEPARAAAA